MTSEEVREISKEIFGEPKEPISLKDFIIKTNDAEFNKSKGIEIIDDDVFTLGNWLRPHVKCGNGFKISIQASKVHYCTPRESGCDLYESYEVCFFNEVTEEALNELLKKTKNKRQRKAIQYVLDEIFIDTVIGYIPHNTLQSFLDACGGIMEICDTRFKLK